MKVLNLRARLDLLLKAMPAGLTGTKLPSTVTILKFFKELLSPSSLDRAILPNWLQRAWTQHMPSCVHWDRKCRMNIAESCRTNIYCIFKILHKMIAIPDHCLPFSNIIYPIKTYSQAYSLTDENWCLQVLIFTMNDYSMEPITNFCQQHWHI